MTEKLVWDKYFTKLMGLTDKLGIDIERTTYNQDTFVINDNVKVLGTLHVLRPNTFILTIGHKGLVEYHFTLDELVEYIKNNVESRKGG